MAVAVIGGGYAGMAAAVTLAEQGVPATVFEAAAHLGGRARRVTFGGLKLDNGLHILLGAYHESLRMIRLVNRDAERALLRSRLDWRIHRRFRLRLPPLPAPLHLVAGLIAARGCSIGARLAAARFVRTLTAPDFHLPQDTSVANLLAVHGQHDVLARLVWRPLCVAALNTPPEEASARVFINVLRDSLGAGAGDSDVLLARCDLSALFPEPAAHYLNAHGGTVLTGHTVSRITLHSGGFDVEARGARSRFSHVICALPPHRLPPVIAGIPQLEHVSGTVARFQYQPIFSVYLQYPERVVLPAPMLGLANCLAHWVFDRDAICGQRGLVAAVISASGPHQMLTQDELALRVHSELERHVIPLPRPSWFRVIAEKRATFACTPGLERPPQRTPLANFFLAGDYTLADYPATIEAAVRSGVHGAREVLRSLNTA